MRVRLVALCVLANSLVLHDRAAAQSIGIFADDCATNCITIPQFAPTRFHVSAVPGPAANGFTGASFRIEGFPPGLFFGLEPFIGCACFDIPCGIAGCRSPFEPPGIDLFWPFCREGACLPLFDVIAFGSAPPNTVLRVVSRMPPLNPAFDCPMITLCDVNFTAVCVEGGTAILNPTGPCLVAVAERAWTEIKRLYD